MAKKKSWKVPLLGADRVAKSGPNEGTVTLAKGSLLHHDSDVYAFNGETIEWHDAPYQFSGTLVLDEGIHSGRSAKYVSWTDQQTGRTYPMFVAELVGVVRSGACKEGGVISGHFTVVKRGQNYGIEYLGD